MCYLQGIAIAVLAMVLALALLSLGGVGAWLLQRGVPPANIPRAALDALVSSAYDWLQVVPDCCRCRTQRRPSLQSNELALLTSLDTRTGSRTAQSASAGAPRRGQRTSQAIRDSLKKGSPSEGDVGLSTVFSAVVGVFALRTGTAQTTAASSDLV
jgi:hypothetical protein